MCICLIPQIGHSVTWPLLKGSKWFDFFQRKPSILKGEPPRSRVHHWTTDRRPWLNVAGVVKYCVSKKILAGIFCSVKFVWTGKIVSWTSHPRHEFPKILLLAVMFSNSLFGQKFLMIYLLLRGMIFMEKSWWIGETTVDIDIKTINSSSPKLSFCELKISDGSWNVLKYRSHNLQCSPKSCFVDYL